MRVATGGRISGKTHLRPYSAAYKQERRVMAPYYASSVRARRTKSAAMQPYKRVANRPAVRYSRTRKMTYNVPKSGAGSTFSKLTFGSSRVPKHLYSLIKNNQSYIYEYLLSRREVSAFGKQSVHTSTLNDQASIQQMFVTIPQLPAIGQYQTGKFILQTVTSKMTFTNQDLATSYVQIYSIVPRFHIQPGAFDPISCWDRGLEQQQVIISANDQYRDVYAKPFSSHNFTLYYKVDKVTTFELQQGQSHCHETTYNINREVYGELVNSHASLRDITKINMIVIAGTPINDLTTKTNVSSSSCAVDIVEFIKKEYTYAASQRVIRTYSNVLPAIATAEIASIGAGVVVAEDEA